MSREGLFDAHRVGDDLFFEIPDSVLGREMLLLGRAVASTTQSQSGFFGGGPRLIVQWERQGNRVILRQKEYVARADTGAAIWRQVSGMRQGPVLGAFDVEAWGPDSAAVVDVTALFTSTNRPFGSLENVEGDRSWIEHVAAFPRNVEVEATQTGRPPSSGRPASGPNGPGARGEELATQRMHWSMVLLPDEPMRPRLEDARVGFIASEHTTYDTPEHGSLERSYIHRFRLEPSDSAAFRRGELVEPVEPIVYWIDPATPDWLKPWVDRGVEVWNEAFEEAGFRDAIRAEVAPVSEDWSLYDARRSVIYWRPSTVANATGGQVVDPRSGEILKGEVNMYHNVQNLLRDWYFTQVAPLDPRARELPLPDSLMGRLVEYVVTHEIGHSIGFPHNMKASAMYPADSIRSESFLRRMGGHVATLMDYSRFNYVAQPEDGIPPELLVPRIGPYDRFAVMWGYRPILEADTPEEERAVLDRWARMQDTIPWLRFTTDDSPNDPYDLTEAVGDADAVRSNTLGLRNLQRVMDMLVDVAERPGEDYELLEDLYGSAVSQWSRYMGHVAAVVGGAETQERYGTGARFTPLPRAPQEEAVRVLNERAFATPEMLVDHEILRRIEAAGAVPRIRTAQKRVLGTLLDASRLNRMVEYEALAADAADVYSVAELMEDVRAGVWDELGDARVAVDVYRRNLQRAYLEVVDAELNPPEREGPPPPFGGNAEPAYASDVRPVLRGELRELDRQAGAALPRAADRMTRLHLEDVRAEIERILDPGG
ncbi:MAG: zinc-dependent metalloprotease [Gemmatimonadetes bacterium]|nr:zinc-dependent metalloprotease [Gemmatimonadota bacterium]